jgi:phenylalanine-4-hydroxylase
MRPSTQVYSNYTEEDFEVWKVLFNRQMDVLKEHVSQEYLNALRIIRFSADRIPDFEEVKDILAPLTGWSLHVVPNICPQKEFFEFLSQKKFTATCWLRSMQQLDYLEEPDMFHDVFAHTPLLANSDYVNFFIGLSKIALDHIDNPYAIELLGRIYWFTIEFGLIRENGKIKIYGAGIISSNGETKHALGNETAKHNFNITDILNTTFRTDIFQENYFVIDSFNQLYKSLPVIRQELKLMLEVAEKTI